MEIIITKGKNRNTLTCKRDDGSLTSEILGPDIPNHDIAHYVIEKKFDIKNGFYGKIKSGMSIAELSNKEIIKSLDSETWLSEIMARNLQYIGSGASSIEQFIELVNWEVKNTYGVQAPDMNITDITKIKIEFKQLCEQWNLISENETLKLLF